MTNDQISLPYLALILVIAGLLFRYFFLSGSSEDQRPVRRSDSLLRSRELAAERMQQMFPQADRRSILWDLQRNGGNVQNTAERILAGRLETPPVTFQPRPAPEQTASGPNSSTATKKAEKPAQPDLITRYNLKEKLDAPVEPDSQGKGWSSNREERQASLQRRREDMILAARRTMEAKIAAENASHGH